MSENTNAGGSAARRRAGAAPQKGSRRKSSDTQKSKKPLVVIGLLVLLVLLLPLTVLTVYVSGYDEIFPNVYVGDTDLSGKSAEEAFKVLEQTYRADAIKNVSFALKCKDSKEKLNTDALGITFQNQETVNTAKAVGDSQNPIVRAVEFAVQLVRPARIDPVITYNNDLLNRTVDTVAKPYEVEPVGYTFEIAPNEVTIHAPVAGVKVDRGQIVAQVERQIRARAFSDIVMEPITTQPEPLNFEEFYTWLTAPAEDAYYTKGEDGKVTVTREKLQCSVDKGVVKQAVDSIEQSGNTTATFSVTTTEPQVLSAQLNENLYKDKLGSYTTHYSGSAARNNNVRLATSRIDGYELMPGEEFSYDQTILPRTAENGYQAAPVYVGNKVESGMGGGICQPSSTLYCAALYANLEITERHNHSMLVSYLPAGLDATIAQGVLDMKFKNNTPYPIKISGQASGGVLTFSIWGYNPENISVEILRGGGGYSYTATRVVKKDGVEVSREQLRSSNYVKPEPSQTPKPSESAKPEATSAPTAAPTPSEGTGATAPVEATAPPAKTQAPVATAAPAPATTPATTPAAGTGSNGTAVTE